MIMELRLKAFFGLILMATGGMTMVHAGDADPIVIAHRGASGYRPEHTLMAYRMGIEMGADYIEPDLVMTKDGKLVARHDVYLSDSTDVADHPEFADRRREIRGKTDWWVFDFTLSELRTLKARQARPTRGTGYDGVEVVPTIEEIIALVESERGDSQVGLYIEMKHPLDYKAMGLDPTPALLDVFRRAQDSGIPVYFQCFSGEYLVEVAPHTSVPLIWLIEGAEDPSTGRYRLDVPLDKYGNIIAGIGPYKQLLMDGDGKSTGVVEEAHRLGYKVHPWTFRADQVGDGFADMEAELDAYWSLGIDGAFSDHADVALRSRDGFLRKQAGQEAQ